MYLKKFDRKKEQEKTWSMAHGIKQRMFSLPKIWGNELGKDGTAYNFINSAMLVFHAFKTKFKF